MMNRPLLAICFAISSLTACATDELATGVIEAAHESAGDPLAIDDIEAHVIDRPVDQVDMLVNREDNMCNLLPSDGPCADLCDDDALATHFPAGFCGSFACTLTTGRVVFAGVCNP